MAEITNTHIQLREVTKCKRFDVNDVVANAQMEMTHTSVKDFFGGLLEVSPAISSKRAQIWSNVSS